jgi:hypothetical protein
MSTAQAESAYCNARKRRGGRCHLPAGWGTRHVGRGPCRKHLGNVPNVIRHYADAEAMEFAASLLGVTGQGDSLDALVRADPSDATKSAASLGRLPDGRRCRAHSKRSGRGRGGVTSQVPLRSGLGNDWTVVVVAATHQRLPR